MSAMNRTPTWTREPATLSAAFKRLARLAQHIYWLNDEINSGDLHAKQLDDEVRHLEGLLTLRWEANNARLVTSCGFDDCSVVGCHS